LQGKGKSAALERERMAGGISGKKGVNTDNGSKNA
jgi:hypothetical protein